MPRLSQRPDRRETSRALVLLLGAMFMLCLSACSRAAAVADDEPLVVLVPTDLTHQDLRAALLAYPESGRRLEPSAVAALPDVQFQAVNGSNLGISDHALWVRVRLFRSAQAPDQLVLQLGRPVWREADAYLLPTDLANANSERPPGIGQLHALHSRYTAYAFELPEGSSTLLIRVAQYGALTPAFQLWEATAFRKHAVDDALLQGLFYGMVVALLIYNAFLFLSTRDRAYFAYILWQSATLFYMLTNSGVGQHQLWPGTPIWNGIGLVGGLSLMCAGGLYFIRAYLLLPRYAPRTDLALQIVQWLAITLAVAVLLPNSGWMLIPAQFVAAAALVLIALAAVLRWKQRFMPAIILLASLLPLLIVGFANIGRTLGWLPETFLTSDALQWVSVLLALVLTYGLSVRVAQLRERATKLQDLLLKDPLTGLLNRNGLFDSGQRQLDRTYDSQAFAAVLWIDLDGLKRINDQFGHAAGDALIQATSARLREAFGPDAVCARLGGDEFAIVLPNLPSPRLAEELAAHALERLRAPYALSGREFRASGSIGVALYPTHAQTLEELLRQADVAMYHAKSRGRDTYVVWASEMEADVQTSLFQFTRPGRP
ncbi:MAG: sensor domain-containing diguanylate cyclase [Thiomonas sp.]|nr:sensor domain-containing diguanylate cyclase [Thiomonas sp.]